MRLKLTAFVLVLLVVAAATSFKVAASSADIRQKSHVAAPTHAILREIEQDMRAGRHERALRMTQRLEQGLHDYLSNGGPAPEQFIHGVYAVE